MKNNKKISIKAIWNQWVTSPHFFKTLFIFIAFFLFFGLTITFIWKRYNERIPEKPLVLPQKFSLKIQLQELTERVSTLQTRFESFSDRLTALELAIKQQQHLKISDYLIALELVKGVLEGRIPLESLKKFLQKIPLPWAVAFLTSLAPFQEIKSYTELEALLSLPTPPLSSSSLWQRLKEKMDSIISIQKVDEKGEYRLGQIEDIRTALQDKNIQKAIDLYSSLSPEERAQLSAWAHLALGRFALESQEKRLLLELARESGK